MKSHKGTFLETSTRLNKVSPSPLQRNAYIAVNLLKVQCFHLAHIKTQTLFTTRSSGLKKKKKKDIRRFPEKRIEIKHHFNAILIKMACYAFTT